MHEHAISLDLSDDLGACSPAWLLFDLSYTVKHFSDDSRSRYDSWILPMNRRMAIMMTP
ncbi:predicted protein [Pyrenophora tritici-repentis Pt-1C-BFP]|uniref:Uncharacterized protein n=1 Tax=Pyrenophora tritici-repentis (strain Pt-1C-BFP) TaxID=426418 RepID=B2VV42_PYRTR|nr:uncharacterized protein PTRG_02225 [Pyrenophora tritici-repentis Pt-1C-BFP]EDU41663.1 predicted protein [Pyrenophora tritici-repentis Pt-1C-BFP]